MNAPGRVLLIGWGGADWGVLRPLLDAGQMPNLRRLMARGATGDLASVRPAVSSAAWVSSITGKHLARHGILGPTEPRPDGGGLRPVQRTARTAKALWTLLSESGLRTHAIGWPASHPAEPIHGVQVSDQFAHTAERDAVHPPALFDTLAPLRLGPMEIDDAAVLTLVPRAAEVDLTRDDRPITVARLLAQAAAVHAAATWALEHEPWDCAAVCYDALLAFSHAFMAYHPPRREATSQRDFELYGGVAAGAYRFHDMMLGRLLELAGDATVLLVSNHGFRCDDRRPKHTWAGDDKSIAWHRHQGVAVMAGPHVRAGAALDGASVLDVTPTVLSLLGLPIGMDMEGRPWLEMLTEPREIESRITWEDAGGSSEGQLDDADSDEAIAHLLALGYEQRPDPHAMFAIERVRRQQRLVLARAWLDARRPDEAAKVAEELLAAAPRSLLFRATLAEAYFHGRRFADCRAVLQALITEGVDTPLIDATMGSLALAERQPAAALVHLHRAEQADTTWVGLHEAIGRAYLRMVQWDDAQRAFRRALAVDPDDARACDGLATACLAMGRPEEAEAHARRATSLRRDLADAHYHLGLALLHQSKAGPSAAALRQAVAVDPLHAAAHRRLAGVLAELGERDAARQHDLAAHEAVIHRRMARARRTGDTGAPVRR